MIAQETPSTKPVQVTKARLLGKTSPVRDMESAPLTSWEKRKKSKKNRPHYVQNFIGRDGAFEPNRDALPVGADPVRQSAVTRNSGIQVEPKVVIEGMDVSDASGATPPDPCGEIGENYFVEMINATLFRVFDKEGNPVTDPMSINSLWNEFGISGGGDPIILHDQEANRWVMTEFGSPFGPNRLLMAVSETSDPTGSWYAYEFTTPSFPDYPKYGIWNNCYYVTTNEGQTPIYFMDRQAMLNGEAEADMQRIVIPNGNGPGFYVPTPVDWDGPTPPPTDAPPMVVRILDDAWNSTSQDAIQMWTFDIDWDNPNNSGANGPFNIPTSAFDSYPCSQETGGWACIPQPSGNGIDGIPQVLMHRAPYRNFGTHESIVMSFIVDADPGNNISGIRWVELRRTSGEDWSLFQEGTFAPEDGEHRFIPAIAMDGAGNIGMAYSVSGDDTYPSLRFTGRRASDPLGEMTVEEYEFATGLSNSNSDRFGDYATIAVDPVNDRTFWFTAEYMKNGSNWGTKVVAFELQRDSIDLGVLALNSPQSSADLTAEETISFDVKNFGIDTQTIFKVGYILGDNPAVIDDVTFTLPQDSIYTHTFAQTVNMEEIGIYELKLFTVLENDQAIFNDTLRTSVEKYPRFDAGISNMFEVDEVICADAAEVLLRLTNFGQEILTSVDIYVTLNDTEVGVINWTGSLASGASTNVPFALSGLINGENTITAYTQNPNGETDQTMENDQHTRPVQALTNGVPIFFELRTDNYPEEISWELEDSNGNVLYSGGDYEFSLYLYMEEWCLDPEACYTFTIMDSYGDGVSVPFGDFTITDAEDHELAALTNLNFGNSEVHDFCATFECTLSATVSLTPATGVDNEDGSIVVNAENGGDDLEYSIDGGVSFQSSSMFTGLAAGTYQVVVQDADDCMATVENVVIDVMVSADWLNDTHKIELFPNPTDGVFKINLDGMERETLDFTIRDARGSIIQHNMLVRYDSTLTGEFSVLDYPSGVYFIVFNDPEINKILRVVKK